MATAPPATITLLGPQPDFESGSSIAKRYIGDDCKGAGIEDLNLPVVGTIGGAAEAEAEEGVNKPETFKTSQLIYR